MNATHDFIKSTTRDETRNYFKGIIKKRLLEHPTADVTGIYSDLRSFEEYIDDSLNKGEKKFLSPMKVKDFEVYKFPLREQSVRGAMAWNAAFPTQQIQPPEKLDVVKVNMQRLEDIASLKETEPEIYENLKKGIYENSNEEIAKKGINVFGLPQYVESIPEWLRPFVDTKVIKNDNIGRFIPVLGSLGMHSITMDTKSFYTNIKSIG